MTTEDEEDWIKKFKSEELHFAAQNGDVKLVRELLSKGFSPNSFDDFSHTPLMYAAKSGHIEVMKILLENGADVNAHEEAKIGNTALREVAENCSYEVAKVLVDAGADPTIPGWMQLTALDKSEQRKRGDGPKVHSLLQETSKKTKKP